jgi:hypothetical protein
MDELDVDHIKGNAVKGVDSGGERVSLERESKKRKCNK